MPILFIVILDCTFIPYINLHFEILLSNSCPFFFQMKFRFTLGLSNYLPVISSWISDKYIKLIPKSNSLLSQWQEWPSICWEWKPWNEPLTTLLLLYPASSLSVVWTLLFYRDPSFNHFSPSPLLPPFISCLKNCSRFLTGLPASSLVPLHFILNTRVRGILLKSKSDLITPLLKTPQWPAIALRIKLKADTWFTPPTHLLLLSNHFLLLSLHSLCSSHKTSWPLVLCITRHISPPLLLHVSCPLLLQVSVQMLPY